MPLFLFGALLFIFLFSMSRRAQKRPAASSAANTTAAGPGDNATAAPEADNEDGPAKRTRRAVARAEAKAAEDLVDEIDAADAEKIVNEAEEKDAGNIMDASEPRAAAGGGGEADSKMKTTPVKGGKKKKAGSKTPQSAKSSGSRKSKTPRTTSKPAHSPINLIPSAEDVRQNFRREDEVRQLECFLDNLITNLPDPEAILDLRIQLIKWTSKMLSLMDYTPWESETARVTKKRVAGTVVTFLASNPDEASKIASAVSNRRQFELREREGGQTVLLEMNSLLDAELLVDRGIERAGKTTVVCDYPPFEVIEFTPDKSTTLLIDGFPPAIPVKLRETMIRLFKCGISYEDEVMVASFQSMKSANSFGAALQGYRYYGSILTIRPRLAKRN